MMKFETAPIALGALSVTPGTLMVAAIIVAVAVAFILGARRETAMFAVFAGVVGVILAI